MNKRNVEYAWWICPTGRNNIEWINEMAEDRWELVTTDSSVGFTRYIFKRPILDQYLEELTKDRNHRQGRLRKDSSDYDRGVVHGLSLAYSMYTQ